MLRRWFFFFLLLLTLPSQSPAEPSHIRDVRVVLFVLDGCRVDIFADALHAGELPTVNTEIAGRGAYFTDALAVFPSATPTGYQALVSGLFPGHSGIPYLTRFDREKKKVISFLAVRGPKRLAKSFRNYYAPESSRTLFDDLEGHPTAAVYSIFSRGASLRKPKLPPLTALWSLFVSHRAEKLDDFAYEKLTEIFMAPAHMVPRFTLVGLLGTDGLSHHFSTFSPRVRTNLANFDKFLAGFMDLLRSRDILDTTYIVVTSDHGMHDTGSAFDLPGLFESVGMKHFEKRFRGEHSDVFVGVRGLASAILSFRGPDGWDSRPTLHWLQNFSLADGREIDVIELLLGARETALIAVREDEGRTRLFTSDGEAVIGSKRASRGTVYSYQVVSGKNDPLRLTDSRSIKPYLDGRFLPRDKWLKLTSNVTFPDSVVQLGQIMADGQAGDVVVIAKEQWGFYRGKAATHGTHMAVDMRVPLLIKGPGIPAGKFGAAQLVDLYPTMRQWFGLGPPATQIDGEAINFRR